MNIDLIPIGDDPPNTINVIIEVPVGGEPVKYEFDKKSGALFVDRILHTPMRYPANYGFVPHTLSPDGDPIDALVVARSPFIPGSVVRARPIGVLMLEDEHGGDEKLIAVPVDSTFPYYSEVAGREDLPGIVFSRSSISSPTTKTLSPTNGCGLAAGEMPRKPGECLSKRSSARGKRLPSTPERGDFPRPFCYMPRFAYEEARDGHPGPHLFRAPRRRGAGVGAWSPPTPAWSKRTASSSAPISNGRASVNGRS